MLTAGTRARGKCQQRKIHLDERMASRNATHVLDYAEQLGMGTQKYVLITIE